METALHDLRAGLSGATVTVTGGFGLVGSRIVHRLRAIGAKPLAVGRLDAYSSTVYSSVFGIRPEDPDVITGDITDAPLMDDVISRSDYVIHAAAFADVAGCTRDPARALRTNVTGTQTVLDAATRSASLRRLCFVSSASVYGNGSSSGATCFAEDDPLRPMSIYANTKAWGEHQTALTLGQTNSYCIVRYFSVYGDPQIVKENSHSWVVAWFGMRAALGLPLQLNGGGRQVRDFVHVDDIAEATLLSLLRPQAHGRAINIGSGTATSIATIASLVGEHQPDCQIVQTPRPEGDPLGGGADTTRMKNILGWTPSITIDAGVRRYLKWLERTPEAIPQWLRLEAGQALGQGA